MFALIEEQHFASATALYRKGVGWGLGPFSYQIQIQAKPELLHHPPPSRTSPGLLEQVQTAAKRQVPRLQQASERGWKGQHRSEH